MSLVQGQKIAEVSVPVPTQPSVAVVPKVVSKFHLEETEVEFQRVSAEARAKAEAIASSLREEAEKLRASAEALTKMAATEVMAELNRREAKKLEEKAWEILCRSRSAEGYDLSRALENVGEEFAQAEREKIVNEGVLIHEGVVVRTEQVVRFGMSGAKQWLQEQRKVVSFRGHTYLGSLEQQISSKETGNWITVQCYEGTYWGGGMRDHKVPERVATDLLGSWKVVWLTTSVDQMNDEELRAIAKFQQEQSK